MKKALRSKILVIFLLVALTVSFSSCGFLLYPERKGSTSGRIDPAVLIMDCAWLFVFVVPGVVALAVDFATGCIYMSGSAMDVRPGDTVDFRLRGPAPVDAKVTVTVEGDDGLVADLFDRDIASGDEMEVGGFVIPQTLDPGEYRLALKVNGINSAIWDIKVLQ